MLLPLVALPILTFALTAWHLRPGPDTVGATRLALVRAGLLVAGAATVLVELLSLVHALTTPWVVGCWSVATAALVVSFVRRYRREPRTSGQPRGWWDASRWTVLAIGGLVLAELVVAVASPPNNYDSYTYHLPKIEHWVVQRDVAFYPTVINRQLGQSPGAEYLLLHLRLLTGGDATYNLLQLAAALGCVLVAARVVAQLGGSRRAQLIAGLVVASTPIVALEATSTQTDLVMAFWAGCVTTLVLDELHRRTALSTVVLLGLGAGLAVLAKTTALLIVGPMLLIWLVAQVRRATPSHDGRDRGGSPPGTGLGGFATLLVSDRRWLYAVLAAVGIAVVAFAVAGPYLVRVTAEFGSPLGPPELRDLISMQRHDPPAVLVNALRIAHTALETPLGPLNTVAANGIDHLSRGMGVDPNGAPITFAHSTFPSLSWPPDEDRASMPVQGALVLSAAVVMLVRPRSNAFLIRVYGAVFWLAVLGFVATVKWQPWGNRLITCLLAFGAPLAGLWLDRFFSSSAKRAGAWVVTAVLVSGACAGGLAVAYGWPRRLVGHGSVFTESTLAARFQRRPQWQADYVWAADAVRGSGAHRIGLVQGYDAWEYPWWILLKGADIESLQSPNTDITPPDAGHMDAIVCGDVADYTCGRYVPPGWTFQFRNGFGYALPPAHPK